MKINKIVNILGWVVIVLLIAVYSLADLFFVPHKAMECRQDFDKQGAYRACR